MEKCHRSKAIRKKGFQYIGIIERPRQIAMTGLSERMIFDFRSGLVQSGASPWRRPEALDASELQAFQGLVYFWESRRLAQTNTAEQS